MSNALQEDPAGDVPDDESGTLLAPGVMLGSHRIVALLGRGGMATVYEAFDTGRLKRTVALKVLPPQFLHDETFARRFDQEALVIAKLEHPAIVPINASGTDDGIPWMSMRLLGGGNMATLLKHSPPDPLKAVGILRRVAEALDYAHVRGVVHRDIKPANILFDRDGRACVGDFGLAQMLEGNPVVTRTGTVVGTPHYMAPEQALGNRIDHRCDVYSLGIVAYEMFFGRTPFTGDSPVAVLLKHVNEPLPVPAGSGLPDALLKAIEKAAAKDPFERWPSAGAFADALDTSLGIARISTTGVQRAAYERAEHRSEPRPRRLTIAAAAVLGTAALAWALVMQPPGPPGPGDQPTPRDIQLPSDGDGIQEGGDTAATSKSGGDDTSATPPTTGPGVENPNLPPPKTTPQSENRPPETTPGSSPPIDISTGQDAVPTTLVSAGVSRPAPGPQPGIPENKTPDGEKPDEPRPPVKPPTPPEPEPAAAVADVPPRCIPVAPVYPPVALRARPPLEGNVVVDVTVGADGTVANVVVVKSPHPVLEEAARKAVMQYTCSPARRNDVPEEAHIQATVVFKLQP